MYTSLSELLAIESLQILVQLTVDNNDGVVKTQDQPIADYTVTDGHITDKGVRESDTGNKLQKVTDDPQQGEYKLDEVSGEYVFNTDDITEGFNIVIAWQQLDFDVVDQAITTSDNLIDSYIGTRYNVPIDDDEVPGVITDISSLLTVYNLYERRKRLKMSESLEKSYKLQMKKLDNISKGIMVLTGLTVDDQVESVEIVTNKTSSSKIYTQSYLSQF